MPHAEARQQLAIFQRIILLLAWVAVEKSLYVDNVFIRIDVGVTSQGGTLGAALSTRALARFVGAHASPRGGQQAGQRAPSPALFLCCRP